MMTIDSGIFLKNHISCNFMLKYYITILLRQFTKTLHKCLNLSRVNENFEICMSVSFEEFDESKLFWGAFIDVLILGSHLKNTK